MRVRHRAEMRDLRREPDISWRSHTGLGCCCWALAVLVACSRGAETPMAADSGDAPAAADQDSAMPSGEAGAADLANSADQGVAEAGAAPADRRHAYVVFASEDVSETLGQQSALSSLVVGAARDATTVVVGGTNAELAVLAAAPGVVAVQPIPPAHKVSAAHLALIDHSPDQRAKATVVFYRDVSASQAAAALAAAGTAADDALAGVPFAADQELLSATTSLSAAQALVVAEQDAVAAVEIAAAAEGHLASSVLATQSNVPTGKGLTGKGVVVAEWDGGWANGDPGPVPPPPSGGLHVGLQSKVRVRDCAPADAPPPPGCSPGAAFGCGAAPSLCAPSSHATHVAGILMGSGASAPALGGPGYAPDIKELLSYTWYDTLPQVACERLDAILLGAKVANNSWGFVPSQAPLASYGAAFSATLDDHIRDRDQMLDVFSAGNSQRARFCNPSPAEPGCAGVGTPLPAIAKLPSLGGTCTAIPPPPANCPLQSPVPAPTPQPTPLLAFAGGPGDASYRYWTLVPYTAASKNTLVVGATLTRQVFNGNLPNASVLPTHFTSFGPTADGRLAPQIVAPGSRNEFTGIYSAEYPGSAAYIDKNGTSMAAPAVTGGVAQLLEAAQVFQAPQTALTMKALVMHSADDVATHVSGQHIAMSYQVLTSGGGAFGAGSALFYWPDHQNALDGPDYMTGYGQMNLNTAMRVLLKGNPKTSVTYNFCGAQVVNHAKLPPLSPIAMGAPVPAGCAAGPKVTTIEHLFHVPAGATKLRVTMAYHDPAPAAGAPKMLVNDLDLVVKEFTSGWHYYPWQLDPSCPYKQAVRLVAKCHAPQLWADHLNNHEQVLVDAPPAGEWVARITASALPKGPQPFALWITID